MPLYYFSMENGGTVRAEQPEELPDNQAAEDHANAVVCELTQGNASTFRGCTMVVENEAHDVVARVAVGYLH